MIFGRECTVGIEGVDVIKKKKTIYEGLKELAKVFLKAHRRETSLAY